MASFPVLNALALILLVWAFASLWGERNIFRSYYPILGGIGWLFVARLIDIIVETPMANFQAYFGISIDWLSTIGDACDLMAAFSFAVGFIRTVRFQRVEEERIRELESLLPICAWCKKYRTDDDQWKPIEQYLREHGGPEVTHGICPECSEKLNSDYAQQRASGRR